MPARRSPVLAAVVLLAITGGCSLFAPNNPPLVSSSVRLEGRSAPLSMPAGSSVEEFVIARHYEYTDKADLAVVGTLPAGVTVTFNPPAITETDRTSRMEIQVSAQVPVGSFSLQVEGRYYNRNTRETSIALTQPFTVFVVRPFRLGAPTTPSVQAGSSASVLIPITREAGFTGPVSFAVDGPSAPPGTQVSFAAAGPGAVATMTVDVPATVAPALYSLRVFGAHGVHADTVQVSLPVTAAPVAPDFTLLATPATATITSSSVATYQLALARSATFTAPVTFAARQLPSGATATFTPSTTSGDVATLTVAVSATTPVGTYTIPIEATGGGLTRQATVALELAPTPDFTLSLTPATLTVPQGGTGQTTVGIARTGNPGAVTLTLLSPPTGITATIDPVSTTLASASLTIAVAPGTAPGSYPLTLRGQGTALTRTTTLTVVVPQPSAVTVTIATPNVSVPAGGTVLIPVRLTRTGTAIGQLIELRVAGVPPGGNAWIAPNFTTGDTATLQVVAGQAGTATLTVSAVVGAVPPSATATVTVTPSAVPDFALLPPPDLVMTRGIFTPLTLVVRRSNGFAGVVTFSVITPDPNNFGVTITPGATAGNETTVNLYASPLVAPGRYVLLLRGTSGSLVRSALVTLVVR